MSKAFQTIGLVSRPNSDTDENLKAGIGEFLAKNRFDYRPIEASLRLQPPAEVIAALADCDLIVVLGGDGTLLAAARCLAALDKPLLCVNLGRLGFLASVSPYEIFDALDEILHGQFIEERRMLLEAQIRSNAGIPIADGSAFNEVTVHRWASLLMIEFETSISGRFLNHQRADGLIVATPTGSTAYALSSGGPIVYPTLESLVLVPVSPHAMSVRPMMVPGDCVVEITLSPDNRETARVVFDGQDNYPLEGGQKVVIRRKQERVRLIHPKEHDFFEILRAKLNWGK